MRWRLFTFNVLIHVHVCDMDWSNELCEYYMIIKALPNRYIPIVNTVILIWKMSVIYGSYEIRCVSKCMHDYIYIHTMLLLEEGTRIVRANGGRRGISFIIYYWRKGPVSHGRSAKTVLLYLYVWWCCLGVLMFDMDRYMWHCV